MKLLILTEEPYPSTLGGGTSYLNDFEKGLNYHKIDYEIIAAKYFKKTPNSRGKVVNLGIPLVKSNSFSIRSLFKLIYYPIWVFSVLNYLAKNKRYKEFGIIHAHEILFSGPLSLFLGRLFHKKVVLTAHGKFVQGLQDRLHLPKFIIFLLNSYEELISSRMDKIFCISREIRDYYSKYNKNCVFIPNFIDISRFKPKIRKKVKTISYIGRLSKEKNVDILIKSAKFFPEKKFLIIGDGPERQELEELAKELNLSNVSFLGRISNIPKIHQKIDLVIYLWKNEPFGLSALEAMASGIPVIGADTNELHYFVGKAKSGIVIPKDKLNAKELVSAIKKLGNLKLIKSCSENAVKTSKDYDYKKVIYQYIQGYN